MSKGPAHSDNVRQFKVGSDDDGVRLDRWFKRHLPQVGFATVSRWARTGQIRVDGGRAKVDTHLVAGQTLRVPPGGDKDAGRPARRELTEAELELADSMVLTQDRAAIVLNKPPGLATQGGKGMTEHVDGLLDAFAGDGPRPRLVHRLDKDTSGVLLIARTPGTAAFFSKRFSGRSARKIYWALVAGVPSIEDGMIELPLSKQPGTGGEKMHVDVEGGQSARTRYRVLDRAGNAAAWVELHPLTGRTHQLRVHMAAIGHPIVGDGKYGGQDAFLTGSISRKMHLHARRLIIDHPDGTPLDVTAPLPEHFAMGMEQLGFDEADGADIPEPRAEDTREEKKRLAKAHAKQFRKERRGERRSRGGDAPARSGPGKPSTGKAATGKAATAKPRGGGKPVAGKPDGKAPPRGATGPRGPGAKPKTGATPRRPAGGAPTGGTPGRPSAPRGKR
ncbi:23S rRNA pseudouridine955/2504/2580 synthase [Novosphingobium chloroacetimidivorans]|uniref:23S rRNA pseudouridine955/2504/2580 synthase n=1 Tax=Novosphingobium chloroacetimidivorans TaxID=1428314 RepID=A0A7W7NXD2_9SPHN|nr:RluA family pseudouridine synthase [Novosphingobium chloroacetimidivorans]MBB4860271.1 23S rRNA pseudouridine955/2504/2580 synthase [Novosphingobium chloroacetimidivorans]